MTETNFTNLNVLDTGSTWQEMLEAWKKAEAELPRVCCRACRHEISASLAHTHWEVFYDKRGGQIVYIARCLNRYTSRFYHR